MDKKLLQWLAVIAAVVTIPVSLLLSRLVVPFARFTPSSGGVATPTPGTPVLGFLLVTGVLVLASIISLVGISLIISRFLTPDLPVGLFTKLFKKTPFGAQRGLRPSNIRKSNIDRKLFGIGAQGAELWVVASGKGGVGKSLISLGLIEDLSREGKVLLLDFDIHNCGLTSLLSSSPSSALGDKLDQSEKLETAYSLLEEFRRMLATKSEDETYSRILTDNNQLPESFDKDHHFNIIAEKFARECRLDEIWNDLSAINFLTPQLSRVSKSEIKIAVKGEDSAVNPRNAFVLPSRVGEETLLLSDVSTLSYIVVFLFLRAFCAWVGARANVSRIILDCHGAHDAFTAASILAAQKLVVVTTTDPGCFKGTLELLNVVEERAKLALTRQFDTAVVFNSLPAWDTQIPVDFEGLLTDKSRGVPHRGIVKIASDYQVREMAKAYEFGLVSKHHQFWKGIREITEMLLREDGQKKAGQVVNEPRPVSDPHAPTLVK